MPNEMQSAAAFWVMDVVKAASNAVAIGPACRNSAVRLGSASAGGPALPELLESEKRRESILRADLVSESIDIESLDIVAVKNKQNIPAAPGQW